MQRLFLAAVVVLSTIQSLRADDWPQWRGPRMDGSSTEKNLPTKWSDTENIVWKTAIPGIGHSSPIIVGDRVFVTSCRLDSKSEAPAREVFCIDRVSGKILWQKVAFHSTLENKHKLNSYSSSTPACDGKHLFVTFVKSRPFTKDDKVLPIRDKVKMWDDVIPEMVVICYDFDGNKIWEKIPTRFYCRHGFCSPPILHKDLIIINADQDAEAHVMAFDKATGKERYRIPRPKRMRSYCAPLIAQVAGKTQMVLSGNEGVASFDPDTGKEIWSIQGPTQQYVASPVLAEGLFFITAGFPTFHNMAIRGDGAGDVTKTHIAWHEDNKGNGQKASYVPSPLAAGPWIYMISDRGPLSVFDAKTGARQFMENLGSHHSGSPVLGDGHVYITDDDGITYVLKANGKYELVARNLLKDHCYSSPAIAGGNLFIRTENYVWRIGAK